MYGFSYARPACWVNMIIFFLKLILAAAAVPLQLQPQQAMLCSTEGNWPTVQDSGSEGEPASRDSNVPDHFCFLCHSGSLKQHYCYRQPPPEPWPRLVDYNLDGTRKDKTQLLMGTYDSGDDGKGKDNNRSGNYMGTDGSDENGKGKDKNLPGKYTGTDGSGKSVKGKDENQPGKYMGTYGSDENGKGKHTNERGKRTVRFQDAWPVESICSLRPDAAEGRLLSISLSQVKAAYREGLLQQRACGGAEMIEIAAAAAGAVRYRGTSPQGTGNGASSSTELWQWQ